RAKNRGGQKATGRAAERQAGQIHPRNLALRNLHADVLESAEKIAARGLQRVEAGIPRLGVAHGRSLGALEGRARAGGAVVAQRVATHLPCRIARHLLQLELRTQKLAEEKAVENHRDENRRNEGKLEDRAPARLDARMKHFK